VLLLAFAALSATACQPPPPEVVWVPAPDFEAALSARFGEGTPEKHSPGDWIVLHADRSTGPWVQIAYNDLPADASWTVQPPPAIEEGVESSVRWIVEPEGSCRFNIPTERTLETRMIQCSEPGIFELRAESNLPGGRKVASNVLQLVITAPGR
jgi:hypothetical protein